MTTADWAFVISIGSAILSAGLLRSSVALTRGKTGSPSDPVHLPVAASGGNRVRVVAT
jgi:hypothetical protein